MSNEPRPRPARVRRQRRRRRDRALRRITLAVLIVAVTVAAAVVAVVWAGRGSSKGITVPSTPPAVLLGQPAKDGALSQNSEWSSLASQVARGSSMSFASVYGPYPPRQIPTTRTFFVVAGEVKGGNHDIPSLMRQEVDGVKDSFDGQAGSKVIVSPMRASDAGGQMQCVSAVVSSAIVGECLWLSPQALVQMVTFTDDLSTVGGMTTQIVDDLHHGHG